MLIEDALELPGGDNGARLLRIVRVKERAPCDRLTICDHQRSCEPLFLVYAPSSMN
jgi:hypothetical protein